MEKCLESRMYPVYGVVEQDKPINQGDIIKNFPIVLPPKEITVNNKVKTPAKEFDLIVMTQSCDLEYGKVELVLTCPVYTLTDFLDENEFYVDKKRALREGNVVHYQMLHSCSINGFESEHLIVDFKRIFSVDYKFLKDFVSTQGQRKRLLPPYRERLSQMFARSFMRVGLPLDIPHFEDEDYSQIKRSLVDSGFDISDRAEKVLTRTLESWGEAIIDDALNIALSNDRTKIDASDIKSALQK
jgi:hypothetical protein